MNPSSDMLMSKITLLIGPSLFGRVVGPCSRTVVIVPSPIDRPRSCPKDRRTWFALGQDARAAATDVVWAALVNLIVATWLIGSPQ
jgi:hypothetical protein